MWCIGKLTENCRQRMYDLLEQVYATARRVHLLLDNLNTHFRKCFEDVPGTRQDADEKMARYYVS